MSASRLSTVLCAQRVLWLENGMVRAYASHDELVNQYPDYAVLMGLKMEDIA